MSLIGGIMGGFPDAPAGGLGEWVKLLAGDFNIVNTNEIDPWNDSVGNSNYGQTNSTFRPLNTETLNGKTVAVFNGSASRLEADNVVAVNLQAVTVVVLIKLDTNTQECIWAHRDSGNDLLQFYVNSGAMLMQYRTDGTSLQQLTGATTVTTGAWHILSYIYDGSGVQKMRLDGVQDASATVTTSGNLNSNTETIGCYRSGAIYSAFTDGAIADVRIFDSALSDTDVAAAETDINTDNGSPVTL